MAPSVGGFASSGISFSGRAGRRTESACGTCARRGATAYSADTAPVNALHRRAPQVSLRGGRGESLRAAPRKPRRALAAVQPAVHHGVADHHLHVLARLREGNALAEPVRVAAVA